MIHPTQKAISLDSPGEWNCALEGIEHGFAHTWQHCYAMQLTTRYPTYLYCFEANGIRVVCPIAERPCGNHIEAVSPFGFSGFSGNGDPEDFPSCWAEFAKSRGYVTAYLTLNPFFFRPSFTDSFLTYWSSTLYFLDLTITEEDLLRGFSRSRREGLRRWEKSEVSIVTNREVLTRFFLAIYRVFFRTKGASLAYDFAESTVAFLLALNQIYIIGAETEAGLQSVSVFGCTPYVVDYLFGISVPEGRQHGFGLIWHAAKHFKRLGIPMLNLGGGVSPDDSLAESKRRFGARQLPLRSLRQVIQPAVYEQLCIDAGVSSTERGSYFPPYQRPVSAR